jgi:septal ring factor EnvC (AmiA/AmiB activator)
LAEIGEAQERRSGDDRRESAPPVAVKPPSAWADPRTWISICGILLTICLAIGGFIASKLSSIDSAMQHLLVSQTETTTRQTEQINQLREKQAEFQGKLDKTIADQTAYNYDLMKQLTAIKTEMSIRNGGK